MSRPVIAAIGVCRRDLELAVVWLRWVTFLSQQPGGSPFYLLICVTRELAREHLDKKLEEALGHKSARPFRAEIFVHPDADEGNYPRSASHQFLRTLECAEARFSASNVLWLEVDAWPTKPTWFSEINAEYQTCGQPFLGVTVGKQYPQMSGIGVYGSQWRTLAPKLANVLSAPDISGHGKGRGCAWDVWARDQTYPQMAESKLMKNDWKNRQARPTRLSEIPTSICLYHQEKSPALIMEIAAARYPEFLKQIALTVPRYFMMNGHESRLRVNGFKFTADKKRFGPGGWTSVFTTEGKSTEIATILGGLVGMFGFREITKEDYDSVS